MTKQQAIDHVISDCVRRGLTLSSYEIAEQANSLVTDSLILKKNLNSFNSLSAKRVKMHMTTKQSPIAVVRVMNSSTASEFLGEEFWLSLDSMRDKILVTRVYNIVRAKLTQRMG